MSSPSQDEIRRRNNPQLRSEPSKSERTRQAILDAALEYLWSHPFRDLTISELMSQTEVARATFYRYFGDLHELLEHLLNELERAILEVSQPWLTGEGQGASQLAESLSRVVKVFYQRGPIVRSFIEAAPLDERFEQSWDRVVGGFDDLVTTCIEREQAAGLVTEFDARQVAIALNRMNIGVFAHHFGRRPRSKPTPVYRTIVRLWISTIYGQEALEQVQDM